MISKQRKGKIVAALAVGVGILVVWGVRRDRGDAWERPTYEVQQGSLTISVSASGNIQSRERVVVSSEVEGRTTILSLVDEGVQVEEGDLLIELDASSLEENKVDQQIRVMNSEAAFIRAREQLAIVKNQSAADVSRAELDYRFAQLNLTKYVEGEYPQELQRAEADINLADEELQRAADKLEWSQRLADEGYLTLMELQADELAARRASIDLKLAQGKLGLLQEYTHQQQLEELESEVQQKEMALERVRLRASADIVQAEADYRAKTSEYERQEDRLERIEEQIKKCRLTAPADGMVVYVTTGGRRGAEEPLREGQEVRERQELIYLPTAAAMMAEVRIHESSLRKVASGLPAVVEVDAVPGREFTGRVHRIGLLPDAQHSWLNPDLKVYSTEVHIDGTADSLRPGMNCRAEIIIDELDDVVYVPLQTVVRVGREALVYVAEEREYRPRVVEIGQDNNRMVHIVDGLERGEKVLLNPPLQESRRPERERPVKEEGVRPEIAPPVQRDEASSASESPAGGSGARRGREAARGEQ